jgi:hypothetical protein
MSAMNVSDPSNERGTQKNLPLSVNAQATTHIEPRALPLDSQLTGSSVSLAATTHREPPPLAPDSESAGKSASGFLVTPAAVMEEVNVEYMARR